MSSMLKVVRSGNCKKVGGGISPAETGGDGPVFKIRSNSASSELLSLGYEDVRRIVTAALPPTAGSKGIVLLDGDESAVLDLSISLLLSVGIEGGLLSGVMGNWPVFVSAEDFFLFEAVVTYKH